ncbi:MAG TPA: condensation domain-containing protein [Jatrophihabitans sp.]|jgi:hypothetical protein|nr:condensation domain-containing protein [Jatrophihabitans sp.]
MEDHILVPFHGPGAGVGPLSWAQKSIWQTIVLDGNSVTMGGVSPLRAGRTVQDMTALLRFMISRHPALRTRLRFEPDGTILQVVSESGVIPLALVEAGDEDPAAVAATVNHRFESEDFDYESEWPVRMAVILQDGVPTHMVVSYLHLYIDALGLRALMADLATMDPVTGEGSAPVEAMQPLDQARFQQTPAAQRQCDASLRHLERVLRTAPAQRFPEPADPDQEPSYPSLEMRSPATRLAVRLISGRFSMDSSQVLLCMFGIALTRLTGSSPFVTQLAVGNRFRPGLAASVSAVAQVSPCMIDFTDTTFEEALARTRREAVRAYKNGYYDPPQRQALRKQIREERGEVVDLSCFYNDRRQQRDLRDVPVPSAQEIQAAVPLTRHSWSQPVELIPERIYLSVDDDPDAVLIQLSGDTRYLPMPRMEELAYGIESAAVQAALDPAALTEVRSVPVGV